MLFVSLLASRMQTGGVGITSMTAENWVAKAVHLHIERRVFMDGNKTVVFK